KKYKRDIEIAEELGNQTFWSPIHCDFRGRFVHMSDFNYNRGDPVRSLFKFASGAEIKDGLPWLEIAVANTFGKKGTWQERWEGVADNFDFIKDVARSPRLLWLKYINDSGKPTAKEPFQFAAACAEYIAARDGGREYKAHLPIWLDATSNGLQHLAMLGRDSKLAEWVNLNPRYDPQEKLNFVLGEQRWLLAFRDPGKVKR